MRLIYTTCATAEEARQLSRSLIGEGLVACSNCLPGMRSTYAWEGGLREDEELVLLLKTDEAHCAAAMQRLAELHPYQTPCILVLPVERVGEAYGTWLAAQLDRPPVG